MSQLEKENIHQDMLKVRCPQCFKLYNVRTSMLQIEKPKFQCTQCEERFSLQIPESLGMEEVIGFAESWEDSPVAGDSAPHNALVKKSPEVIDEAKSEVVADTKECEKCGAANSVLTSECGKCGVIFDKYRELKNDPIGAKASQKLKEIWLMVMNHYEDEDLHQEFVRQCRKRNELEYASSRYMKILEASPNEELALKFKNKIQLLVELPVEKAKDESKKKFKIPLTSLAMLLSSIVMFVGYMVPEFRNLMGIGAAFLFITTAIRLVFK